MYGALYGLIKYVILGKEANDLTGNQTLNATQEPGNNCFYLPPHNICYTINYLIP